MPEKISFQVGTGTITIETGKYAKQADGSVTVQLGETIVLVAAVAASKKFPAPVYRETVLAANFEDAERYFLASLLQIHYAHTIMLERQHILSREDAQACLRALDHLDLEKIKSATYDGTCEDLFFYIEDLLAALETQRRDRFSEG